MAIDDRTANLGLPMPNAENLLEEDVERLREFAEDVDLALQLRPLSTAVTAAISAAVANLATANALSQGLASRVPTTRSATAGQGLVGGGSLNQDISFSLSTAALTSLGRADTAVQPSRTIFTSGAIDGGGDLSGNRTITTIIATKEEAETGTNNVKIMTALRVAEQRVAALATEVEAVGASDNAKTMTALRVAQQRAALPSGVQVTAKTAAWTLAAADQGRVVSITTGGVTVPSTLPVGTTISIWNNSAANQTITQGSGLTLYNAANGATGNRTLAGRGLCVVQVISAGVVVISGAGLS